MKTLTKVKCCECVYASYNNGRSRKVYCDAPFLRGFCKTTHGSGFSCGWGEYWILAVLSGEHRERMKQLLERKEKDQLQARKEKKPL